MKLPQYHNFQTDSTSIIKQMLYTEIGKENKLNNDSLVYAYADSNNINLCGTAMLDHEMIEFKEISLLAFDSIMNYWISARPK